MKLWCEKCELMQEDGAQVCKLCGGKLTEYHPILSDEEHEMFDFTDEEPEEETVPFEIPPEARPEIFMTVLGEDEAKRIMSLLEDVRIPSMHKVAEDQDVDAYLAEAAGRDDESATEDEQADALTPDPADDRVLYDLYVPEEMLREALRVVLAHDGDLADNDPDDDELFVELPEEPAEDAEEAEEVEEVEEAGAEETKASEEDEEAVSDEEDAEQTQSVKPANQKKGLFGKLFKK